MRKDLAKVLTEKPRSGSDSRNLKTRFHENGFDDRESREDKYSFPKKGKMLMHNRDLGSHDGSKNFTDVLGPLKKWLESQVGKNWDKVYSEIKETLPNTNKQNHHLIDTHLPQYIHRDVEVVKTKKGRKVYDKNRLYGYEVAELWKGELYVDPDTHVIMRQRHGLNSWRHRYKKEPVLTDTGYSYSKSNTSKPDYDRVHLGENERLELRGLTWVYCKYEWVPAYIGLDGKTIRPAYLVLEKHHTLSKRELKKYGVQNPIEEKKDSKIN